MGVSQKLKIEVLYNPAISLGVYLKDSKVTISQILIYTFLLWYYSQQLKKMEPAYDAYQEVSG